MSQLQTVQSIYAAFGRGDVPTILATLADDVEWEYGIVPNGVPWLAPRRGRGEAGGFFQAVGMHLDITHFAPKVFLEAPGLVVVLLDLDATVKATGLTLKERDEVHIWHFDAAGKVVKFRHCVDTYSHVAAYTGKKA